MPICPNQDCISQGSEQPPKLFAKDGRQLKTCLACRDRRQQWRIRRRLRRQSRRGRKMPTAKPLPKFKGWWPSVKSIFRRDQLEQWLADSLAAGKAPPNKPTGPISRMAPPSPSPWPQPVPERARGEWIEI